MPQRIRHLHVVRVRRYPLAGVGKIQGKTFHVVHLAGVWMRRALCGEEA